MGMVFLRGSFDSQHADCLWRACQVMMATQRLGRAIKAAELVLREEIPLPPPSLFDELKNSVFSLLLPYWAAFWKHWLKRSPTSAQKAPGGFTASLCVPFGTTDLYA